MIKRMQRGSLHANNCVYFEHLWSNFTWNDAEAWVTACEIGHFVKNSACV